MSSLYLYGVCQGCVFSISEFYIVANTRAGREIKIVSAGR